MKDSISVVLESDTNWLDSISEQLQVVPEDNHMSLPENLGVGYLNEFLIEEGLSVSFGELKLTKGIEVIRKASRSKTGLTVFFKYLEKGRTFFKPITGAHKEVKSGGVQFFSSNVENQLIFPSDTHCFLFRVNMSFTWLRDNLIDFISLNEAFKSFIFGKNKIMHFEPLTNRFLRLFSDVFKSEFNPKLNHILVKDKGYEAVVLFFDHFYKQFFTQDAASLKYAMDDQKKLYELIDFMKANLHLQISLDQLSREAGFSKSKLQAMFHYFFHQTIYTYLKNLRFEEAVKMLTQSDKDIRNIAHALGYGSSTHFINIFKKHFGVSPKKYRMKYREIIKENKKPD